VLMTDEEAPQYKASLTEQMAVAQSILTGLGYSGEHFKIMQVKMHATWRLLIVICKALLHKCHCKSPVSQFRQKSGQHWNWRWII